MSPNLMNTASRTATKAQAERLAKKLNVEISDECDSDYICIFLYTPKGFRFKATDCHTAATSFSRLQPGSPPNDYEGTKADGWGHVMEDLEYGVEECDNENCGYCERGLQNS